MSNQITRYRGDTVPDVFILTDENGAPVDISVGYSFILTVSADKDPTNTTNQKYTLAGTIADGPAGQVNFTPSPAQADQLGKFFYDIQVTYPSGAKKTVVKDKYVYLQDITKA